MVGLGGRSGGSIGDRSRREFLRSLLASSGLLLLPGCDLVGRDRTLSKGAGETRVELDPELLRLVGQDVLPSELGSDGVADVVVRFREWLAAYEPGVELDHGYLTTEISHAPADPTARWAAQLRQLDAAGEAPYAQSTPHERRRRLRTAVTDAGGGWRGGAAVEEEAVGEGAPPEPSEPVVSVSTAAAIRAPHVVLALLHFFFSSPRATDLCFEARIQPLGCRGLGGAPARPV